MFIAQLANTVSTMPTSATPATTPWSSTTSNLMPDPPKMLLIGPDRAGNLLEVIALVLADDELMAIHAMPLRAAFHELLPPPENRNA